MASPLRSESGAPEGRTALAEHFFYATNLSKEPSGFVADTNALRPSAT